MTDSTKRPIRRVLFVNHSAKVSGAELSMLELIGKLDRDLVHPIVACPEGDLSVRLQKMSIQHIPVDLRRIRRHRGFSNTMRDITEIASVAIRLARTITKYRIDIAHANSTIAHLYAAPAAKLARVPVIWHVRDLVELGRVGRFLFWMADAVACISDAVELHIAQYGGDLDKLWTVTNGIDISAFRGRAHPGEVRKELGIPTDAPVILQISQITPWKGHDFLLSALPRVITEFPDLRVLFVGESMTDEDADYAERLTSRVDELGLAETVIFTGWREDVASLIADSTIVALPSRNEPFGRAALEGLALGKPVIGTNTGGLAEIIKHRQTGLLVDHGDVVALAEAIIKLLSSSEIRAYMSNNATDEAERLDIRRTANQIQNLYEDLLVR